MSFPVHEFRLFLAALLKWGMDYPTRKAVSAHLKFGNQRKM